MIPFLKINKEALQKYIECERKVVELQSKEQSPPEINYEEQLNNKLKELNNHTNGAKFLSNNSHSFYFRTTNITL